MRSPNIVPIDTTVLFNLASSLVKAVGRMTVSGQPSNNDTFVLGSQTYTLKSTITAAVAATATLTHDGTNVENGKQVVVGDQTYTFKTTITPVYGGPRSYIPNEVKIGADADASLGNLVKAINQTGVAGTDYSMGTVKNPLVSAAAVAAQATVMTARATGAAGNSIAKSEDSAHLDWDGAGATFTGGVSTVANEIKIGADAATTLDNIKKAINGTGTPGTEYSVGTVANTQATATTNADTTQDFEAITGGVAGNSVVFTESMANTTISGSGTLGGTTSGSSTKGRYTFTDPGMARRFIITLGDITGTGTLAASLYNAAGTLIKALQATQAQSAATDTAYEVEIMPGDYIEFTMSAAVSDADSVKLSVR